MFCGGEIYDVVWVSIHTTCGMNAHLYHIVGLSMLDAEDRWPLYAGTALISASQSFPASSAQSLQRSSPLGSSCCFWVPARYHG